MYFEVRTKRCFNSTLVQLKGIYIDMEKNVLLCFNSTLVQLKESKVIRQLMSEMSFNSTLVQLKVYTLSIKTS